MRLTRRDALSLLAAPTLAVGSAYPALAQARTRLEVIHWWVAGGESEALRQIRDAVEARGVTWVDTGVQGQDAAKTMSVTRVLGGNPPGILQWHVGKDLPELLRDGVIRDVQEVATADRWDSVLPRELQALLKVDGKYASVPLNIHGGNVMFSNTKVMRQANADLPKTWDDVVKAAEKLRQANVIPIALGGQSWQETTLYFYIVIGTQGADFFEQVYVRHELARVDQAKLRQTFEDFARLKPFVDRGSPGRSWTDTANLIATGRAGLFFQGDWAKGELLKAGLELGRDYDARLPPGNDGVFLAVADTFCFSNLRDPAIRAAQEVFARATMSPPVQEAFNRLKGSIPVRTDVSLERYDAWSRSAAEAVRGGARVVPSGSMGMKAALRTAVYDVVSKFWNSDRPDPADATRGMMSAIERNLRA
jgi:glucose/mannose transport system substrate-binding protein